MYMERKVKGWEMDELLKLISKSQVGDNLLYGYKYYMDILYGYYLDIKTE